MSRKIGAFEKTDHFMLRQWDRNITDSVLVSILNLIDANKSNTLIIVSRNLLKKAGLKINKELFIKVDNRVLITCYYSDLMDHYRKTKNNNQEYFILN